MRTDLGIFVRVDIYSRLNKKTDDKIIFRRIVIMTEVDIIAFILLSCLFIWYSGINFVIATGNPRVIMFIMKTPRFIAVIDMPYCSCVRNFPAINQNKKAVNVVINQLTNM